MTYMLCRNRVADYGKWKAVFDSHEGDQDKAGFHLISMWRSVEDPNNVWFLFEIDDIGKANEFITSPKAEEVGRESGVLDGECHFLESVDA